jgi:hypothetical protein
MSRNLKLLPHLAGVVAIVLTAAACGSSGNTSAAETTTTAPATTASSSETATWANSVCSAFVTWRTQVVSAGKSVAANPTTAQVNEALANARSATTTLKTTLKGLETPSTKAADEARTELQQLQGELQNDAAVIKRTITTASSSTMSASQTASTVKTGLLTMQSQLTATGKALRSLPSGEAAQAFTDAPACKTL